MTSPYWPLENEVDSCIRTEAEELAGATVLAVHEPMMFRRIAAREEASDLVSEMELLKHVIQTKRPTPIIGESGFGKSHVIRWLDLQLQRQQQPNWHIVRIGKNSSLRHALLTLLNGLEGPIFDDARRKIDTVGAGLNTRDVAEHLIVFVGARLAQLYADVERQKDNGGRPIAQAQSFEDQESLRFRAVRRHAKPEGLVSLIGDPNFKDQLTAQGRCFYQIAKRLTEGSSDEEIATQPTSIKPDDLTIHFNLGDLSFNARSYVRNARLNTSEEMREEASSILNECLSDASRTAFQQLFQFHGGSFQDLFLAIRRELWRQGKSLFVLVEDMATVSAIEDVLIDSLMQEDVREGRQVLCPLHSAIAVTTGYQGYVRRRATLSTRAGYEWYIDRSGATEMGTLSTISDFCGRYLNAARHGERQLVDTLRLHDANAEWPGVWRSGDPHYDAVAEAFGVSPKGFPLFPYSATALEAMARRYCTHGDVLEFNPRKILKHILREPLGTFRKLYEIGEFPPEGFAGIGCPGNLQAELGRAFREDLSRMETVAGIWGFGAETVPELAYQMPAEVADEFGLAKLARLLEGSERQQPKSTSAVLTLPKGPRRTQAGEQTPVPEPAPGPGPDTLKVAREVDEYFSKRNIPQPIANLLRKCLAEAFEQRKQNLSDWYGLANWPSLTQRKLTLIHIPFNKNNPPATKLTFGTDKEFTNRSLSLPFKQFMVAILRREAASEIERKHWTYPDGGEDYNSYMNFLDDWLPAAAKVLAQESRNDATDVVKEQLGIAAVFDPLLPKRSLPERLNQLVTTTEAIRSQVNFHTGLQTWDAFLEEQVALWSKKQSAWLLAFATNRHGVEGDLVTQILRGSAEAAVPARAQRIAQTSSQEFAKQYAEIGILDGCTTREAFRDTLTRLRGLIAQLSSTGQFRNMDGVVTAKVYSNRISKILEDDDWEAVKCAIAMMQPFEATRAIRALHGLNPVATARLYEVLDYWRQFYELNRLRLQNENEEQGASRRQQAEAAFGALVEKLNKAIEQGPEESL